MSLQRSRTDNLQRILSAFKHFEKKLDKLQEDVNFHGHTLSELRVMVANLSAGTMMTPDINIDSLKRPVNTAIQYDERYHIEEPKKNRVKHNPMKSFPSKITAKSFQSQKYGLMTNTDVPYRINKTISSPKNSIKPYQRHRKGEISRKGTSLRNPKTELEKNMFKVVTTAIK